MKEGWVCIARRIGQQAPSRQKWLCAQKQGGRQDCHVQADKCQGGEGVGKEHPRERWQLKKG